MAANPIFIGTPRSQCATISVANTNRDGTGTIANIFTAGSNGSIIYRIRVKAVGTTTAGMIRFYRHDGSTHYLTRELPVAANTASGTNPTIELEIFFNTNELLLLPVNHSLRASTNNAESFNIITEGGDY